MTIRFEDAGRPRDEVLAALEAMRAGDDKEAGAGGSFHGLQTVFWSWRGDIGLV